MTAGGLAGRAAAGRAALAAEATLVTEGGLVAAALGGAGEEEWRHYPAGDVYDGASHAQYFYHAHPPGERAAGEHGHFHCFLRARGMPQGLRPLVLPELAIADNPAAPAIFRPSAPAPHPGEADEPWCHLAAVALAPTGQAIKLFTTNRWVTGETWYRAADVAQMLDRFALAGGPAPPVERWLAALLAFYRPQLAGLLDARDECVMSWRRKRRGKVHVFEDRRLEITSSLAIDVTADLDRVEAELRGAR